MEFYTEKVCTSLGALDPVKAIRAIHRALLQIEAGEKLGFDCLDNAGTISALRACMADAGHIGYTPALTAGLHGVKESRADAPDKPAPVQRRAAKPPVDHGCWRDPEARKVRAKVNAWANANVRSNGSLARCRPGNDEVIYADAMGWTREKAKARIEAHRDHLAANPTEYRW